MDEFLSHLYEEHQIEDWKMHYLNHARLIELLALIPGFFPLSEPASPASIPLSTPVSASTTAATDSEPRRDSLEDQLTTPLMTPLQKHESGLLLQLGMSLEPHSLFECSHVSEQTSNPILVSSVTKDESENIAVHDFILALRDEIDKVDRFFAIVYQYRLAYMCLHIIFLVLVRFSVY